MAGFNGSGTFVRTYNWVDDKNASIPITASRMDTEDNGFAAGLSACITRDGQSPATANLPMGGFKLTNLGAGATAGDSVRYEQVVLLAAGGAQTVTLAAAGTLLTLESTDAGASLGPVLKLHRNSASPATNDATGGIDFDGEDSASNQTTYARIYSVITDPVDGTEDGAMAFSVVTAGSLADELVLTGAALYPATNAGLDIGAASQRFAAAHVNTVELGNASDTTLSRASAGMVAVEGVTIEPGANRASVRAHKNGSSQAVATTAETQVTFGTEAFDVGSAFSSNAWTPPAGKVLIAVRVHVDSVTSGDLRVRVKKDSTTIAESLETYGVTFDGTAIVQFSIIDDANGSNVYRVYVESTVDNSYSVYGAAASTYFCGSML